MRRRALGDGGAGREGAGEQYVFLSYFFVKNTS